MTHLRHAAASDVSQIMAIAASAPTAAQWGREQYGQMFSANRLVLVIEENDQIVGFIVGRGAAGEWEIENLVVTAAAQGRGLGSQLLRAFLHHIRCKGGRDVFLEVRESNQAGRAFYAKWAFIQAGRRKGYYHDPPEDALVLRFCFPQGS